jgi:hypothetical protein
MSEVDLDEDLLRLADSHDVVIVCDGTAESFAKWKRTRLQ